MTEKPSVAPLAERLVPKKTGYLSTRHAHPNTGHTELAYIGFIAFHDLWSLSYWIQGYEGADNISMAFVERVGPWLDNMLQAAYERGRADLIGEIQNDIFQISMDNLGPNLPLGNPELRFKDGRPTTKVEGSGV